MFGTDDLPGLTRGGRDIRHAMAMTIPEAWEGERDIASEVKGF